MIIGIYLKYFKTYSAINYIPISNGQRFNGLVGNNGIGKSSVLEGLDCLFNNSSFNFNTSVSKSGIDSTTPHIVPIFLIKKDSGIIKPKNSDLALKYSNYVWSISEKDILSQNREHLILLNNQMELLKRDIKEEDYYILPIGIGHDRKIDLSIFNVKKLGELVVENFKNTNQKIDIETVDELFNPILQDIIYYYEYIYIPNDIDPSTFTNLENNHIQSLMGTTLTEVIEKCVPKKEIIKINKNLKIFLKELEELLIDYSFRTSSDRQLMIRKANVYNLIIEDFFKTRKLHKKSSNKKWLEVNLLSSGEKQKAIIDLTQHFLNKYRNNAKNVILAVDEPESSLHMSACYDQFNSLFEISNSCSQLLFSTHWYGFIPTISSGNVCVITQNNNKKHCFDLISSNCYREEVKQSISSSRGALPFDIRLKSINDFIQSIVSSILDNKPFNWLICEGSSEKVYFEKYYMEEIQNNKLRIIPVGGAAAVKKIYQNLLVTYDDFKKEVKGKIMMLLDTDTSLVEFETKNNNHDNLKCYRIVNDDKLNKTILVDVHKNPKSPKTEIEDSLCGKTFFQALNYFKKSSSDIENFIDSYDDKTITEESVYYSLDLSPSKHKQLNSIFKEEGFKFKFSEKYCELIDTNHKVPEWIIEIKNYFIK